MSVGHFMGLAPFYIQILSSLSFFRSLLFSLLSLSTHRWLCQMSCGFPPSTPPSTGLLGLGAGKWGRGSCLGL